MASRLDTDDEEVERRDRDSEGVLFLLIFATTAKQEDSPLEAERRPTALQTSQMRSASSDGRLVQAQSPYQRFPAVRGRGASLPAIPHASHQPNVSHRAPHMSAYQAPYSRNQEFDQTPLPQQFSGQRVASAHYLGQQYRQGPQVGAYHTRFSTGPMSFGHPQNYANPNPFHQFQPQQPMPFAQFHTGYYPMQQHFPRQAYDNATGVAFRPQQGNLAAPSRTELPAFYGASTAASNRPALHPIRPSCESQIYHLQVFSVVTK